MSWLFGDNDFSKEYRVVVTVPARDDDSTRYEHEIVCRITLPIGMPGEQVDQILKTIYGDVMQIAKERKWE